MYYYLPGMNYNRSVLFQSLPYHQKKSGDTPVVNTIGSTRGHEKNKPIQFRISLSRSGLPAGAKRRRGAQHVAYGRYPIQHILPEAVGRMNSPLLIPFTIPSLIRNIEPKSQEFNILFERRSPSKYSEYPLVPIALITEISID